MFRKLADLKRIPSKKVSWYISVLSKLCKLDLSEETLKTLMHLQEILLGGNLF